jgi:hypothetical protein
MVKERRVVLLKKSDSVIIKSKCCSNKTQCLSMAQARREREEERGRKRGEEYSVADLHQFLEVVPLLDIFNGHIVSAAHTQLAE